MTLKTLDNPLKDRSLIPPHYKQISHTHSLYAALRAKQQNVSRAQRKQAVGHRPDNLIDLRLQFGCIDNAKPVHIQNHVAIVRHESLAKLRLTAQTHQFAADMGTGHWNYFNRQCKSSQY